MGVLSPDLSDAPDLVWQPCGDGNNPWRQMYGFNQQYFALLVVYGECRSGIEAAVGG